MSDHAVFSPSAAGRWIECPGSIAFTRDIPRTTNVYADEGTAAHIIAARALTYKKPAAFFIGEEVQVGERVFVVDEEMAGHVQVYLDEVRSRVGQGTLLIEERVSFSEAIQIPNQFGTSDTIIVSECGLKLDVIDLKYGAGVKVYAEDNFQMMIYALAVLETFAPIMESVMEVSMTIVQPRMEHVDTWTLPIGKLQQFIHRMRLASKQALLACAEADQGKPVPLDLLNPGEKQCRFCEAKVNCPALQRFIGSSVFEDFKALDEPEALTVLPAPAVPGPQRIGKLFGVLDLIEDWCRAVRSETERMVMAGMTVIGPDGLPMKLVEGRRGHRAWADAATAEAVLTGLLPPEKVYVPRTIVTPAVIAKLLDKKKTQEQWASLQHLITQAPGKPKITVGSDPAPPYNPAATSSEFSDLTQEIEV